MMTTLVSLLGAALMGVFAWAFSLQSRVSIYGQRHEDLLKLIDTKFHSIELMVDTKFESSNQRLERIERALNGALHRS